MVNRLILLLADFAIGLFHYFVLIIFLTQILTYPAKCREEYLNFVGKTQLQYKIYISKKNLIVNSKNF